MGWGGPIIDGAYNRKRRGRSSLDWGNMCKGPEAGKRLMSLRTGKTASELEQTREERGV